MSVSGLGWTFDTVAEAYDRFRPTYPAELYRDLLAYQPLSTVSHALEIGLGTGQATPPILAAGCRVTAVEPGRNLAAIAQRKLAAPGLTIVNAKFEDCCFADESFDLVYSASAFHWVPEETGYPMALRCLKNGGAFVRFASHLWYRIEGQEALWEDIQRCYERYMPGALNMGKAKAMQRYDERAAEGRSAIAERYGFTDVQTRTYEREFRYSGEDFVRRISVESDKIAMEPEARECLLTGIAGVIDRHGGQIIVRDMIDMNMARKPGR